MRFKVCAVVIMLLLISGSNAYSSDQEDGIVVIKTLTGDVLVWNQKDNHFTLEITGKEVKPQTNTESVFLNVDGIVLQVQSVAISEFLKDAKSQKPDSGAILKAHQEWEAEYIAGVLGKKLSVQTTPQKLSNGKEALFWKYDMPEGLSETVKKQFYLSMLSNNYVVFLNGVVESGTTDAAVHQLLLVTAATLKTSSDKIDVNKLRESIKHASTP